MPTSTARSVRSSSQSISRSGARVRVGRFAPSDRLRHFLPSPGAPPLTTPVTLLAVGARRRPVPAGCWASCASASSIKRSSSGHNADPARPMNVLPHRSHRHSTNFRLGFFRLALIQGLSRPYGASAATQTNTGVLGGLISLLPQNPDEHPGGSGPPRSRSGAR
jgi:hypothetical protein